MVITVASFGVVTVLIGYSRGKNLKFLGKIQFRIQRTMEPFRKTRGSLSLLRTFQFFFVALFSVSRNNSKINYAFDLIQYLFKVFASLLCRPQAEQEKNFSRLMM